MPWNICIPDLVEHDAQSLNTGYPLRLKLYNLPILLAEKALRGES